MQKDLVKSGQLWYNVFNEREGSTTNYFQALRVQGKTNLKTLNLKTNTMKNTKTISRIESILSSGVTVEGKLPIGSFVETKNGKREVVQHVTKKSTIIL